jgi:hypothetical protein
MRARYSPDWLFVIRRFVIVAAIGNLVWEFGQMPLYTLWQTGTAKEITFAALHCTAGDLVIASVSLLLALVLFGSAEWPRRHIVPVIAATVAFGVIYTIFSEYMNTILRASWSYSSLMPRAPWLGTGLAPLAQWLVIPTLSLTWACRSNR